MAITSRCACSVEEDLKAGRTQLTDYYRQGTVLVHKASTLLRHHIKSFKSFLAPGPARHTSTSRHSQYCQHTCAVRCGELSLRVLSRRQQLSALTTRVRYIESAFQALEDLHRALCKSKRLPRTPKQTRQPAVLTIHDVETAAQTLEAQASTLDNGSADISGGTKTDGNADCMTDSEFANISNGVTL